LKRLVVNADDFGFTPEVNAGIVHAHRHGILTSTTLMATGDAFEDAVRLAKETPGLDVGCHLVLVQGNFPPTVARALAAIRRGEIDVEAELRGQIEKVLGMGLRPTHLDTHKHMHVWPAVFSSVVRLAQEFRIPYVRLPFVACSFVHRRYAAIARRSGIKMTDHFLGFRLTGSLTEDKLAHALSRLREGTTEFMCHPGWAGPELMRAATRLKESREKEIGALTSPRIRQMVEAHGIELTSFGQLT